MTVFIRKVLAYVFILFVVGCSATEICGNLLDDDGTGGDLPCPEPDKDFDGYESARGIGNDCDDNDRFVYPGIYQRCGADGYQLCQPGGNWSSCVENSSKPLCEATGGGRCYYIDRSRGDDSNDGSFESPWKTYLRVVSYTLANGPYNRIALQPGDVVYFFSGVYEDFYAAQKEGAGRPHPSWFFLRDVNGTAEHRIVIKAYPGEKPVLRQIGLEGCDYITLEGIEVAENPLDDGIFLKGSSRGGSSDYVEIRNMFVHDNDGVENNNACGIKISQDASYARVHHNVVSDNYDRNELEQNNSNIVLFGGTGNHLYYNLVSNESTRLSSCIKYKHGKKGGYVEMDHNILWHCAGLPGNDCVIGSGMPGYFHHNVIADSAGPAFRFRDFGGPTFTEDILVEYNTIIDTWTFEVDHSSSDSRGEVIFRNNIIK